MGIRTSSIRTEANLAFGSPSQRSHSWGLGLGNQKNSHVCMCVCAHVFAARPNAEMQIKASDHTFPSSPDSSHKTILVPAKCRLRKNKFRGLASEPQRLGWETGKLFQRPVLGASRRLTQPVRLLSMSPNQCVTAEGWGMGAPSARCMPGGASWPAAHSAPLGLRLGVFPHAPPVCNLPQLRPLEIVPLLKAQPRRCSCRVVVGEVLQLPGVLKFSCLIVLLYAQGLAEQTWEAEVCVLRLERTLLAIFERQPSG